ncbi:DoxX family protein [Mycolicibacterium arseniciresistens]|uniref:DoxX family protein n=1 Tax=Mycolicibacterium arseniciresistens TaxID=3062257 RepID=A0ABT8UI89_9MYCO|nr:DoxX family protein [Mycolicibacterium arseniciresistens]MDO3637493.1 DoxX family protein [Mycolicibacterium arseniciresistens]
MTAPRTYVALAAFQAGDAVACGIPLPPIAKALDSYGVPDWIRWVLPTAKAASVVGLLSAPRYPWLARLTSAMLAVYFVLAVGAHLRIRDKAVNTLPAATFLLLHTVMAVRGPRRVDDRR